MLDGVLVGLDAVSQGLVSQDDDVDEVVDGGIVWKLLGVKFLEELVEDISVEVAVGSLDGVGGREVPWSRGSGGG